MADTPDDWRSQLGGYPPDPRSQRARPSVVDVVFHTYCGFLVFVTQTGYRIWAAPEDARQALRRLHRFKLSWGT